MRISFTVIPSKRDLSFMLMCFLALVFLRRMRYVELALFDFKEATMKVSSLLPVRVLRQLYQVFFGTRVRRQKAGQEKNSRRSMQAERLESRWAPAAISFVDFSSVSGLTLNGNAAQAGNVLRLTPDAVGQAGSAFFTTPFPISPLTSFSTNFEFFIKFFIW